MHKQIATSATIILLFAFIAVVATTSLQHASALIATTSDTSSPSEVTAAAPITAVPLKIAHAKGSAWIDTFTDGVKTYTFPGDPAINSRFHEPDAPIPTHKGMTWVSSNSYDAFDTATGKLEVGDYAQQADGTYIVHLPPQTYTDATSTSKWLDRYIVMTSDPTADPTASFSPASLPQSESVSTTTPALESAKDDGGSTTSATESQTTSPQ